MELLGIQKRCGTSAERRVPAEELTLLYALDGSRTENLTKTCDFFLLNIGAGGTTTRNLAAASLGFKPYVIYKEGPKGLAAAFVGEQWGKVHVWENHVTLLVHYCVQNVYI